MIWERWHHLSSFTISMITVSSVFHDSLYRTTKRIPSISPSGCVLKKKLFFHFAYFCPLHRRSCGELGKNTYFIPEITKLWFRLKVDTISCQPRHSHGYSHKMSENQQQKVAWDTRFRSREKKVFRQWPECFMRHQKKYERIRSEARKCSMWHVG